jgi:protein SCO1/2
MNRRLYLTILVCLAFSSGVAAQSRIAQAPAETYTYDQKLNQQVPLDLEFRDEFGGSVRLSDFFGRRPVILVLVQYQCPKLCGEVLNGLVECLRDLPGRPGEDFEIVTVSFDPREGPELARAKKEAFVERYGRAGAVEHWHWLTGDQEAIARLTEGVGFRYAYSKQEDRYAHGSGLVVLTPDGRNSRYFYGILFRPQELDEALTTARANRIGRPLKGMERVLLLCYDQDPNTGSLSLSIMKAMRVLGALTVLILGGYLFFVWRRSPNGIANKGN